MRRTLQTMDDQPDLTMSFAIHRAQRDAVARYAAAIRALDEGDRSTRGRVLVRWAKRLSRELREHELVEDQLFFPSLRSKVGSVDATLAQLEDEHRRLAEMVTRWPAITSALADPHVAFVTARDAASSFADELGDLLGRHLATEDVDVLPLFWRHYTATDYDALFQQAVDSRNRQRRFTSDT